MHRFNLGCCTDTAENLHGMFSLVEPDAYYSLSRSTIKFDAMPASIWIRQYHHQLLLATLISDTLEVSKQKSNDSIWHPDETCNRTQISAPAIVVDNSFLPPMTILHWLPLKYHHNSVSNKPGSRQFPRIYIRPRFITIRTLT